MKSILPLLPAMVALLPLALADSSAPDASPMPQPVEIGCDESLASADARSLRAREFHSPLNALLVFVHDHASADAAAPRVAAFLATPEGKLVEEPLLTLSHLVERMNCYGSDALREALRPMLDEHDLADSPEITLFREQGLPIIEEMNAHTISITQQLEAVTDGPSAARAAAALTASYATMAELAARLKASAEGNRLGRGDLYRVAAIMNERRLEITDRFLHAYAHAQSRPGGPFPELTEAIRGEWKNTPLPEEVEERMMQQMEPAYLLRCEQAEKALREWLALASTICDKESADAAAAWLEQRSAELGIPIGTCWHDYASNMLDHPSFYQLSRVLENTTAYFYYALPSYFGSEKLKALFPPAPDCYLIEEAEPEPEPMPVLVEPVED